MIWLILYFATFQISSDDVWTHHWDEWFFFYSLQYHILFGMITLCVWWGMRWQVKQNGTHQLNSAPWYWSSGDNHWWSWQLDGSTCWYHKISDHQREYKGSKGYHVWSVLVLLLWLQWGWPWFVILSKGIDTSKVGYVLSCFKIANVEPSFSIDWVYDAWIVFLVDLPTHFPNNL